MPRIRRRPKWVDLLGFRESANKAKSVWKQGLATIFVLGLAFTLYYSDRSSQTLHQSGFHGASRRLLATEGGNTTEPVGHGPEWERCDFEMYKGFDANGNVLKDANGDPIPNPAKYAWVFNHFFFILVIFIALAIICDDFFVPSLEVISEKLKLSEDVAGATFMAAGSSAPELFSSVAGVAVQSDVGIGTIVGSALFNLLIIIALTAALAGQVLTLDWRPLARDSFFYAMSIGCFIGFAWDGLFTHYESVILLVLYALYIVLMVFNPRLMDWMGTWKCCCSKKVEPVEDGKEKGQEMNGSTTKIKEGDERKLSLTGGHARRITLLQHRNSSIGDLEGQGRLFIHHQRGSIAGALMLTHPPRMNRDRRDSGFQSREHSSHVPSTDTSRTDIGGNNADMSYVTEGTLRPPNQKAKNGSLKKDESYEMQARATSPTGEGQESMIDSMSSDDQLLPAITVPRPHTLPNLDSPHKSESSSGGKTPLSSPPKLPPIEDQENEGKNSDDSELAQLTRKSHASLKIVDEETVTHKEEEQEEEEDEEETMNICPCLPCCPPVRAAPPEVPEEKSTLNYCKLVLKWMLFIPSFPFLCLFSWTIPDCSKEHNKKYYIGSFLMSVFWIAALSFAMVTLIGRAGCILHIDIFVMGLVIVAIGTSVPDALSSVLVARDGFGDMAVSNAIGSNVFDINLGLGLPFLIRIIVDQGMPISLLDDNEAVMFANGVFPMTPHAKFGFILLFILVIALSLFFAVRFRLNKWIGISFVCMYVMFLVYAFVQELYCDRILHIMC